MEKIPRSAGKKGTYESPIGTFETLELQSIVGKDIGPDDRAFIYTESGNRYMIRRSKSRNGATVVYNEREGFTAENGHPFLIKTPHGTFATVGKPFEHFAILDEKAGTGQMNKSTNVVRIEVRKGVEAAIAKQGTGFSDIAKMIKDQAHGRHPKTK